LDEEEDLSSGFTDLLMSHSEAVKRYACGTVLIEVKKGSECD
jgi:hypothetical protein